MQKNKQLVPIFIVVFVDILGFSIILPLLPYYAGKFGATPQLIGLLIASYSFCQFIAAPILGSWSDRYGRRPVLLYSQIGSCLGFILLGVALHLPDPIFWLFVARVIDGISGGNLTVAQAYISDITKPEERAKVFGMIIGVSFGLGFMLGTTLNAFLSEFGYDIPAYAAAGFSFASIMATTFLLPETEHHRDEERPRGLALYTRVFDYLALSEMRRLLLVFFFMVLPFALYVTMFAIFAEKQLLFTAKQTSLFLAFVGFLGIIWQGLVIGPIVNRFGDYKALIIGLVSSTIGLYYISFVDVWWKLIFVAFFFSFGHGIARPALTSIVTQAAPPKRRGGVIGATTSIESFSRIIAPASGGWIMAMHPSWLGWIGGALFTVSTLIAISVHANSVTKIESQRSQEV
jgi:DHA1 family tetracycline resistance protein-like MFS transporter